ncbi:helix-turn-helix domain-containing protein (plasmid) [Streptomyces sp. NBC_00445]|uniref:hypothetical protein n=1 Tax=Streptomyces sp. NBC_00445 TaxID=2975745 RepID=UPI002E245EB1
MRDEQNGHTPALAELRERLNDGLARIRLNKTDLAKRAGLGRTTVQEAFQPDGPVPSANTVAALAHALRLDAEELLKLRQTTEGGGTRSGPGRPIPEWEPHDLEVHPAGYSKTDPDTDAPRARVLPGYVPREHDRLLSEAVRDAAAGSSRIVFLVGSSSTGKTRACWEAVQSLADNGWWLWHPFDPTRAEAALEDLHKVRPRTVVWLNEAQHYLADPHVGERIAAAVHNLLVCPEQGPVLVLGTLWPEYATQYTALPTPGRPDSHSRVRELLAGRTLTVPEVFDAPALATAVSLADKGDPLLADALTRAQAEGRVTQDLAGAPELLHRFQHGTPAARAVLEAAMDARRLGTGLHLPQAFLTDAAIDYLSQTDYDQLTDDWAERAFAELAEPVHGKQAPLRRTVSRPLRRSPGPSSPADIPTSPGAGLGPVFRLADYLEQHGRTSRSHRCPPGSFWDAAHTHLTHPATLNNLARAAEDRHRLQWAHHLYHRAADHGDINALYNLGVLRKWAGDRKGAEILYRQAADHGNTDAMYELTIMWEPAGDRAGAEALARRAADHGCTDAMDGLAGLCEDAGDREGAEALYREAADHGSTYALHLLAERREEAGDQEGAETLARRAADHGDTDALRHLARLREKVGDREGAIALYREAADHGSTSALSHLAWLREEAGDREEAESLYRKAADRHSPHALDDFLTGLALLREEAGDREGAETLARQATDHSLILHNLAALREEAGDREGAEILYRQAADHGNTDAMLSLAFMREKAGDWEGAEILYRQAADHGNTDAFYYLAFMREEAGDREGAETLARQAADHGNPQYWGDERLLRRLWPFGLDPDGRPTPPWQWSTY